jgi:hypothetical protein
VLLSRLLLWWLPLWLLLRLWLPPRPLLPLRQQLLPLLLLLPPPLLPSTLLVAMTRLSILHLATTQHQLLRHRCRAWQHRGCQASGQQRRRLAGRPHRRWRRLLWRHQALPPQLLSAAAAV